MSAQDPSIIGMNHPAFQVSKGDLIKWVKDLTGIDLKKVENGKDGVVYAELLKKLYGNEMKMKKIKKNSKTEYDFEKNWKLVQDLLTKKGVTKPIPVNKIMKGKFQDNLEFLQWFKHYFDFVNGDGGGTEQKTSGKSKKSGIKKAKPQKKKMNKPKKGSVVKSTTEKVVDSGESEDELSKLQLSIEGLEKERNFYFGKLREIEVMCQGSNDQSEGSWAKKILDVLYKTDAAEEFQQPDDEPPVVKDETF